MYLNRSVFMRANRNVICTVLLTLWSALTQAESTPESATLRATQVAHVVHGILSYAR